MRSSDRNGVSVFGKLKVMVVSIIVFAMFGAAFANTGCLTPWEDMDNMVVASTVTVDKKGNFDVDGAVTSASVKALGFVSGSEAVSNAYDECIKMSSDAGINPSWYDSVRYNNENRRLVDYQRASGQYNFRYGKESYWDFWGNDSKLGAREVGTKDYAKAVESVSGINSYDLWDDLGLTNPVGQSTGLNLHFCDDLMRTFDLSGDVTDNFGIGDSFGDTFGIQQFVWKIDNAVGGN